MALYTQYRPQKFADVVGQEAVVKSIKTALKKASGTHAWLFVGPSGTGKTTLARIVAAELGATASAIHELNAASLRGIDTIRAILEQVRYKPMGSPCAVYILDEMHKLTDDAQNALLKVLEDAPKHVFFMLCTTEPQKVIPTIRTRALEYQLSPVKKKAMVELLFRIAEQEEADMTEDEAYAIAEAAGGSPRMALNLLEKVLPVLGDIDQVEKLLVNFDEMQVTDGPIDLAKKLLALLEDNAPWAEVTDFLWRNVLGKKVKVDDFKRALLGTLGYRLTKNEEQGLADQIQLIEASLFGPNTEAGFTALVFNLRKTTTVKTRAGGGTSTRAPRTVNSSGELS